MQLVRISCERFCGIEKAELELGPGLNVLFGPNDLGKSSLADAIRVGFLLPHSSSGSDDFLGWKNPRQPKVQVVYRTEPTKFFRVTKIFGAPSGSSLLESSRDGVSFTTDHSGRRVDEEVRGHLSWGIPAPGGRGGPKGIPRSFLATALLAKQGDVDEILSSKLSEDGDDSGQKRIARALEALAHHPLFAKALALTQERVDEAFTATGLTKRGKNDPFPRMREAIQRADEGVKARSGEVERTRSVNVLVLDLKKKRLAKEAERDLLVAEVTALEGDLVRSQKRRELEAELTRARTALSTVDQTLAAASVVEHQHREWQAELARRDVALQAAESAARQARAAHAEAQERLRIQKSEASARIITEKKNELARRQLEIESAQRDAQLDAARAERCGLLEARVSSLENEVKKARENASAFSAALVLSREEEKKALAERDEVRALSLVSAWREAGKALRSAEERSVQAQTFTAQAEALRADAAKIEAELNARPLPLPSKLVELRALERDLAIAERTLAVGLSVEVRAKKGVELTISRDGKTPPETTSLAAKYNATFEAARELEITVGTLASLVITGGDKDARAKAQALRDRWEREAAPILKAAQASDLGALDALIAQGASRLQEIKDRRREADNFAARVKDLGPVDAALKAERAKVADADKALAGIDRARLFEREAMLLPREFPRLLAEADDKLRKAQEQLRARELRIREDETRLEGLDRELKTAQGERDQAKGELHWDWKKALEEAKEVLVHAATERAEVLKSLQELEGGAAQGFAAASEAVRVAETTAVAFERARDESVKMRDQAREALAAVGGQLEIRKQAAALVDRNAAAVAVAKAEAALALVPAPSRSVTDADITGARSRVQDAQAALSQIDRELHQQEGALGLVGGAVSEEKLEQARVALELAKTRERELEREYEAWRLLLATLRDAEKEQATHLGKALVGPVSERFKELAGDRYEGLALGTQLETEGVIVAGAVRSASRLSVGTREQLATVFRLALAQELGSVLMLDDQLVQSDLTRMAWFSALLREASKNIQIVVFTCRPFDYLDPSECPSANGSVFRETAEGSVRAVDLARVIVRT